MELSILFGGASFEHEISVVSAITVKEKLSNAKLSFIFCDSDHQFYKIDERNMKAKFFSSGEYKKMPLLQVVQGGFLLKKTFSKELYTTTVLNLIHGSDGEDGAIASLFDFYQIKYIGPRRDACVFSFDKRYTKYFAQAKEVKSLEYEVLHVKDIRSIEMALPYIIKPARLGSSIGVSVIKSESEVDYALDVAFEFDDVVLIEPFINNVKEYNVAGCKIHDEMHLSIVEEPQKQEFLDFDKKYLDFSRSASVSEADIDEMLKKRLYSTFEKVYKDMFEGAIIRCDFFVINNEIYLNEVNPIPGSMANYLFDDFENMVEKLSDSIVKMPRHKVEYEYIHKISAAKGK